MPLQVRGKAIDAARACEPWLCSWQQGRACAHTSPPSFFCITHAPAAIGVLSSQVPVPNPLHKEKTAQTIAHFFPFFFCTQIYTGYYTHLYTDSATQNTQLSVGKALTAAEAAPEHSCTYRDHSIPAPLLDQEQGQEVGARIGKQDQHPPCPSL